MVTSDDGTIAKTTFMVSLEVQSWVFSTVQYSSKYGVWLLPAVYIALWISVAGVARSTKVSVALAALDDQRPLPTPLKLTGIGPPSRPQKVSSSGTMSATGFSMNLTGHGPAVSLQMLFGPLNSIQ